MAKKEKKTWKGFRKLEPLEVYLLAADNPIGKKQFRPIFRRKRNGEILTREQVVAIKRGRRVLRKEMKERGLKRRIDFEVTATNLGLFFDRNKFLWPFFLWLIRDNTAAKILATTAVLTTTLTVAQPVIEYVTQFVTQFVDQIVQQMVDRIVTQVKEKIDWQTQYQDRFTISLSDEMKSKGLELSETPGFEQPKEVLTCMPSTDVPCISISEIPYNVDSLGDGEHHETYFAYTFYCRYIDLEAENSVNKLIKNDEGVDSLVPMLEENHTIDYEWGVMIGNEGVSDEVAEDETNTAMVSDAIWVMVIEDEEVILCAKKRNGVDTPTSEVLPTDDMLEEFKVAYLDRSVEYIERGLNSILPPKPLEEGEEEPDPYTIDDLHTLDEFFETEEDIIYYTNQIDQWMEREGITDLTQLMLRTENPDKHYREEFHRGSDYSYYRVYPEVYDPDETDNQLVSRTRTEVLPYIRPEMFIETAPSEFMAALEEQTTVHKYTVVIWLEGDDPQCTNDLMNGHISLNFQIKGDEEQFMDTIVTTTQ